MKRTKLVAGIAALPLLGGVALSTAPIAQAAVNGCAAQKLFEVGGAGDGTGKVYDAYNKTLPNGVEAEKVVYSGDLVPLTGTKFLDEAVAEGVANVERAVRAFHAACPGSRISVVGYSEGALVAGNALENLAKATDVPHDLVDGVLYGDPRRPGVAGAGLNGGAGGLMGTIPTFLPKTSMQGVRKPFTAFPVRTICKQNDAICNSENPITNLVAFLNGWAGYLSGDHGYDINPLRDAGSGDLFIRQAPKVPYGQPLPVPSPTPWQLFNGNFELSQQFVRGLRDLARTVAPPQLWRELTTRFPWLERL
ncbi:hypothetical protein JOF53_007793 [Crossiella equi]|uniref:Cutinase n=1 Tax=Crossiella equi TaxID=130796 RepID=A0ABS5AQT4_9PSEU|nr:PE-PPE domain-containing protein [Crossiella equi]MBP2478921.1 hypothetical protein [Crossiella equi]